MRIVFSGLLTDYFGKRRFNVVEHECLGALLRLNQGARWNFPYDHVAKSARGPILEFQRPSDGVSETFFECSWAIRDHRCAIGDYLLQATCPKRQTIEDDVIEPEKVAGEMPPAKPAPSR